MMTDLGPTAAQIESMRHTVMQQVERRSIFQDQAPREAPSVSTRPTALDGLRGLAAMHIVLRLLYLVAVPFLKTTGGTSPGSPYWWISNTPLKALSAGSEAVLVFFVLSGVVVALPALGKRVFRGRIFSAAGS